MTDNKSLSDKELAKKLLEGAIALHKITPQTLKDKTKLKLHISVQKSMIEISMGSINTLTPNFIQRVFKSSLIKKENEFQKSATKLVKENYPNLSIVGIMRQRKTEHTIKSASSLFLAFVIYFISSRWVGFSAESTLTYILLSLIILLVIQKTVLDYRIYSGLYGSNEREAREIVSFIIQESNKIDFTDKGKPKKIISDEDLLEVQNILTPQSVTD